jgi:hypothetical protein
MSRLRDVAAYLYEQERIDGDEFEAVMGGRLRSADVDGWRAAAASPRPWDAIPTTFQERSPAVVPAPSIHAAPVPAAVPSASPEPAPEPSSVPLAPELPPVRTRRAGRRLVVHRRLPPMPGRLRRSVAAFVRDPAADTER